MSVRMWALVLFTCSLHIQFSMAAVGDIYLSLFIHQVSKRVLNPYIGKCILGEWAFGLISEMEKNMMAIARV